MITKMRPKIFNLFILSVLTLVLCVSLVSALTITPAPTSITLTPTTTSATLNVTGDGNFDISLSGYDSSLTISDSNNNLISLAITNTTGLVDVASATFNISAASIDDDFGLGIYSTTLTINATNDTDSHEISVLIYFDNDEVCECDNLGNLKIEIDDIENNGISGTRFGDEEEWFPMEEIEITIDIENDGDEDVDNIVVEWGLYNTDKGEWVIDDEENDFDLKDGDDKTITITFQLDDVDEFEDNDDYVFYVWATGEDDDFDGNDTCISDSDSIEIVIEEDFVVLDNVEFSETAQCGDEVQITADVWNIGEDDQDDVYVSIYNKELGINKMIEIGDVDAFDDSTLDILVEIPEEAAEKWYTLLFYVYDDDDVYENDYDDDKSEFSLLLNIEGSCSSSLPTAVVSASLESGGEAGEELIVKSTITNTGTELVNYELSATGYSDWASSYDIEPNTFLLNAGASKEVLITLDVDETSSGEQTFDIEIVAENTLIGTQSVSVTIEESEAGFLTGITGNIISDGDNKYLWIIGVLNLVLILIIIIVAVSVSKK